MLKIFIFNTKTNIGEIDLYFENNEKKNARWRHKSEIFKKKCKSHDTSTIILPLAMTWVSKEAVWSTLVHLFGLERCFPAKIEQTQKIFQKNPVTIQWILMVFVGFLNFNLKNSGHNKQIIVSWAFLLLWTPTTPSRVV